MTETSQLSGKDLARQALAEYKKRTWAVPTNTTARQKPRRVRRPGDGRDPVSLATAITALGADLPLETGITGGNLLDQWPSICPTELATTVQPVSYDPERGILDLRPSSPAYATQLRLFQQQLAKHLNGKLGRPAVRGIRVLAVGATTAAADAVPEVEQPTPPAGPVRTRETASPGYRATLEAALTHRPDRQPTNPYVLEALERQEQALRANRQPETEHREAEWEIDRLTRGGVDRSAAVRRAALAFKRHDQAGGDVPRRAFDVA